MMNVVASLVQKRWPVLYKERVLIDQRSCTSMRFPRIPNYFCRHTNFSRILNIQGYRSQPMKHQDCVYLYLFTVLGYEIFIFFFLEGRLWLFLTAECPGLVTFLFGGGRCCPAFKLRWGERKYVFLNLPSVMNL